MQLSLPHNWLTYPAQSGFFVGDSLSDVFELDLTAMAHGGAALGRHEGRTIFVPHAMPGERVRVEIVEDKERYARARVLEILTPSPHRVTPPCPYSGPGRCGGCHWQHIDYAQQLVYKRDVVIDQLKRIGQFDSVDVLDTIPSSTPYNYRAHSTFMADESGSLSLLSDDGAALIKIDECQIMRPALNELLATLDMGSPEIERIGLQVGTQDNDRSVVLEVEGEDAPEVEVDLPISINLLTGDNQPVNLIGSSCVTHSVLHRKFRVTAGSFFQANAAMVEAQVKEVLVQCDLHGGESVLDLYSGVGVFAAFLAEQCGLVTSVESYPPAVSDAEANLADLTNVDLIEGSVEAVLASLDAAYAVAVVDPPPSGLAPEVIDEVARLTVPRIVYVSSDPATLARDAKRLTSQGYQLGSIQPIDLFPQTFWIESITTLNRVS